MDETADDYRPVSRLAVAALATGAVSALAVVSQFAWVLPLVAIGLAVAALADVGRAGAAKAGRLAAVAGLALAVGFGTQAVTSSVVSRWLVERRAAATARLWLDAVRAGRLADAISVCGPRAVPAGHGHPGEPLQSPQAAAEHAFGELPAVQAVRGCRGVPGVTAVVPAGDGEGAWDVRLDLAACGLPQATLRVEVAPHRFGTTDRWLVNGFALER